MCDYSLTTRPNRPGENGEDLVLHRFPSGTRGFISRSDQCKVEALQMAQSHEAFWQRLKRYVFERPKESAVPAVCLPPGALLRLHDISVRLQRYLRVGPVEEVIFFQPIVLRGRYRDAIMFGNGRHRLLQELEEGQRARVLDLSSPKVVDPYEERLRSGLSGRG